MLLPKHIQQCCISIQFTANSHIDVRIVASKTRVAPLKKPAIPRLELLGVVILSRLVNTVTSLLLVKHRITNRVDSMAVLYWIRNDRLCMEAVCEQSVTRDS